MSFCKQCGDYVLFPNTHKCPPAWDCWQVDATEEDARKIYAIDAEHAAEKYAEKYDSNGDYPYANGHGENIFVRPHDTTDEPECFEISAQQTVNYYASKTSPPKVTNE